MAKPTPHGRADRVVRAIERELQRQIAAQGFQPRDADEFGRMKFRGTIDLPMLALITEAAMRIFKTD